MSSIWSDITNPAPALGDWSGDGLTDLAVGGDTNFIRFIQSDGTWAGGITSPISLSISSTTAVPTFGKIDTDNLADLLVMTDAGLVQLFPNTGNPANPYSYPAFGTNLLGTAVLDAVGLTSEDVNGDGVVDILVSDKNGNIWEFHGDRNQ